MRFQVPQNIDIPDTIIFGLSFLQILYLGGGLGFSVFLFLIGGILPAIILGTPVLIFAALFAFFKHNGQSFQVLFQALIRFFINKRTYIWMQNDGDKKNQGPDVQGIIRGGSVETRNREGLKETIKNLTPEPDFGGEDEPTVEI